VFITVLGIYWWAGGAGFPFGRNDIEGPDYSSLLTWLDPPLGGLVVVIFGLPSLAVAMLLDRRFQGRGQRRAVMAAGGTIAVILAGGVLDARMITLLPPLGLLIPVQWIGADWPTVFRGVVAVGAALFFLATVAFARRTPPSGPDARQREAERGLRWIRIGRVSTVVAMACPLPYAAIRLAWSRGWALGAPEPFVAALLRNQPENVYIEPILAGFAVGGAVLTGGLLCQWGRRIPRWIPLLGGRQVPVWFPLFLGGSAVMAIFGFGRSLLTGRLGLHIAGELDSFQAWGQPHEGWAYWGADGLGWFLFPLWAISLAIALVGYYYRYRELPRSTQRALAQ
jgi:hypothetical protein